MTLCVSTSSPQVAVALIRGSEVAELTEPSRRNASSVVLKLIDQLFYDSGTGWNSVTALAVDIGPGSFTGVKVGVTMVKIWGFSKEIPVIAVNAFDLISSESTVAIPQKRGHYFLREPNSAPTVLVAEPDELVIGYGFSEHERFPSWAQSSNLISGSKQLPASEVVPLYVAEPSISLPKIPFPTGPDRSQ